MDDVDIDLEQLFQEYLESQEEEWPWCHSVDDFVHLVQLQAQANYVKDRCG